MSVVCVVYVCGVRGVCGVCVCCICVACGVCVWCVCVRVTHRRVKEFGYSCHQRRLTWSKEKKNWTVAQWSKVLFLAESKFCI